MYILKQLTEQRVGINFFSLPSLNKRRLTETSQVCHRYSPDFCSEMVKVFFSNIKSAWNTIKKLDLTVLH